MTMSKERFVALMTGAAVVAVAAATKPAPQPIFAYNREKHTRYLRKKVRKGKWL